MEEQFPEDIGGIAGMSIRELCEAAADEDVRLGGAAIACACAAAGAALLSRAAYVKGQMRKDEPYRKALALCLELEDLADRLDTADELVRSFPEGAPASALSAGIDASISLLEAAYFGQSLARLAADSAARDHALDLGTASMLLDAAAGSALMSASGYLSQIKDADAVRKAEELVWAITHDRIGAKKQVLDIVDKLIRGTGR
jgi:formiminotetrahydrofolate cyclodeaminase